jgi:hypothetical protein
MLQPIGVKKLLYQTKGWLTLWTLDPVAARRTCMWGKRVKPFLWGPCPLIPVPVSVGIQGHEATQRGATSRQSGCAAVGSGYQQSEHAAF